MKEQENHLRVSVEANVTVARKANVFKRAMRLAFPWQYGTHYPGCLESVALALRIKTDTARMNAYGGREPSAVMCRKFANWLEIEVSYYNAMIRELREHAERIDAKTALKPGLQALARLRQQKAQNR